MNDFADNYSLRKWLRHIATEWKDMPRSKPKPINRKFAAIAAIGSILFVMLMHFYGAQTGGLGMFVEMTTPRLISTNSWVRYLEEDPTAHGYSIYGFLEERKTDAAVEHALEHIHSEDDYLWLNAATYLGSRGRSEAIPYLIKSLRHTASRSVGERVRILERLSGRQFGADFSSWKSWYLSTDPRVIPDWESALGHNPSLERIANKPVDPTASTLRVTAVGHC